MSGRDAGARLSVSETSGSTAGTHRPGGDTEYSHTTLVSSWALERNN